MLHLFISYSHEDGRWVDRTHRRHLVPFLADSLARQDVGIWYDYALIPGDKYREVIESQIDQAQMAILLVSQDFLNSQFIRTVELPRIEARANAGAMLVVPILVGNCDWQELDIVGSRQMLPDGPRPLVEFAERDAEWDRVRHEVLQAILKQLERLRGTGPPRASSATSVAVTAPIGAHPPSPTVSAAPSRATITSAPAPSGSPPASASVDGLVSDRANLEGGPGTLIDAVFSIDGRRVLAGYSGVLGGSRYSRPPAIVVWDLESRSSVDEMAIPRTLCLAFSPDRRQALAGDPWGLDLIDLTTKHILPLLDAGYIRGVRFLPDGMRAICVGDNVQLWDLASALVIRRFEGHREQAASVAVSPDGKQAISIGADAVRAWDVETGHQRWHAAGFKAVFQSAIVSPDGRRVLVGDDGAIRVLDAATGRDLDRWTGFTGQVLSLAFSPDGTRVASGGTDNVVCVWNASTGATIESLRVLGDWTPALAFSPDGRILAAGTGGTLRIRPAPGGSNL